MRPYFHSVYLPAMLGASIEYYDIALYGYMAPILVPVFFPSLDKTTAYFFYFFFEFLAAIVQVFGAAFFGTLGDKKGRKIAMYSSILGTSLVTFLMCLLPTYRQIGLIATILFVMMRALQSFFLGGEYNGGAIYIMEHEKNKKKHGLLSGLYCACTVGGIVLASMVAFLCLKMGAEYFRVAYAISFLLALIMYTMRLSLKETPAYRRIEKRISLIQKPQKIFCLHIIVASLFFGLLYGLPTRILNALLPIATGIHSDQIMILNSACLILYMGLLILAGLFSCTYGEKRVMKLSCSAVAILSFPLMILISSGYWLYIIVSKIIFTILTATFIGPFHSWAHTLSQTPLRYTRSSISYSIGKCFSSIFLACSFLLYDHFKNITILGIILSLIAIMTMRIFYETSTPP